jgi:hypothetical protein
VVRLLLAAGAEVDSRDGAGTFHDAQLQLDL